MPHLLRNGVAVVAILFAAACGGSGAGLSPTAPTAPTASTVPTASAVIIESTRLADSAVFDESGVRGCGLEVWARNANNQTVSFRVDFDAFGATGTRIASSSGGVAKMAAGTRIRFTPPWKRETELSQPLACSEIARFELRELKLCEPQEPEAACWPDEYYE